MPRRPRSRCPGCRQLHDGTGRCRDCRRTTDRRIKRATTSWRWVYDDPRWKPLRELVLVEEPFCRCGCGRPADVVDHIERHRGDPLLAFDRRNCQGMAKRCHDAKTAAETWGASTSKTGAAVPVTVVVGPPCSGKTSHVTELRRPGDLVLDYDALAVALGSPATHTHPAALHPFVCEARDAVLARLSRRSSVGRAWIIQTRRPRAGEWPGADVVVLDVDAAECRRRAIAAGRPAEALTAIDDWWIAERARAGV